MPIDRRLATSLYVRFVSVVLETPGLDRYRRQITGSCCKPPSDVQLVRGINAFLVKCPQFSDALLPLVKL